MRAGKSRASKFRRMSLKRHDMGLKTGDRANQRHGRLRKGKPGLKRLAKIQRVQFEDVD